MIRGLEQTPHSQYYILVHLSSIFYSYSAGVNDASKSCGLLGKKDFDLSQQVTSYQYYSYHTKQP